MVGNKGDIEVTAEAEGDDDIIDNAADCWYQWRWRAAVKLSTWQGCGHQPLWDWTLNADDADVAVDDYADADSVVGDINYDGEDNDSDARKGQIAQAIGSKIYESIRALLHSPMRGSIGDSIGEKYMLWMNAAIPEPMNQGSQSRLWSNHNNRCRIKQKYNHLMATYTSVFEIYDDIMIVHVADLKSSSTMQQYLHTYRFPDDEFIYVCIYQAIEIMQVTITHRPSPMTSKI